MKRSLVTALFSIALLGGTRTSAHAQFSLGLGLNLTVGTKCGPTDNGGSSCKGCLVPGWSGCYPQPVMYGGMMATKACQSSYPSPYAPNYGYYPNQGNYGGFNQGYAWMQQLPAQARGTPGISTVPPPGPAATPGVSK